MAIKETLKKLVSKVLNIGTPPEKEVLYKEVIKRKAPQKSAEALVLDDIKNSIKKIWTPQDEIESSNNAQQAPVKTPAKKKAPTKKSTTAKKSTTKKPTAKKPASKTTDTKKTTSKKSTTTKATTNEKKAPAKKTATKKSETSKKTTTKTTKSKTAIPTKKSTAKTETTPKSSAKKTVSKQTETTAKTTTPKAPAKKTASQKSTSAKKGSKRDEKIALYVKDIKKHYGEVDEAFVAIVVKNLGPSIYRKDAELVSCSDPKELDTVRRNFLIKKLGIDASKAVLDAAIQDVCTELKGVRTKYRATFYYALAKKFKKESVLK